MTTGYVISGEGASAKYTILKDPDAVLDYPFNWTAWLMEVSDSIATATAVITGSATVDSCTINASVSLTASDLAAVATGFTSAAGAFLSTQFKVGNVVTSSGWTGANAANNGRYYLVSDVAAGTMSVKDLDGTTPTISADAAGEAVTISSVAGLIAIPVVSGGTVGEKCALTVHITTAANREDDRTVYLQIKER